MINYITKKFCKSQQRRYLGFSITDYSSSVKYTRRKFVPLLDRDKQEKDQKHSRSFDVFEYYIYISLNIACAAFIIFKPI